MCFEYIQYLLLYSNSGDGTSDRLRCDEFGDKRFVFTNNDFDTLCDLLCD